MDIEKMCIQKRTLQQYNWSQAMIDNNKITEVKLVSCTGALNQMHLISANVFAVVIVSGAVAYTTEILSLHTVQMNF